MEINGNTIYSEIPDGIIISERMYGKCLVATKEFSRGELIYHGKMMLLNNDEILDEYNLTLVNPKTHEKIESFCKLNKYTHFVEINGKRQIYGFDGFMNHSCNPTIICNNKSDILYDVIAFRNIKIGDEITCDYALFDYKCNGHEIPVCLCGERNCRGSMTGFYNLDINTQLSLLGYVDNVIFENFLRDNKLEYCGEIKCPDCCKIKTKKENYLCLISTKHFNEGDVTYQNKPIIFEKNNPNQRALYKLDGRYHIASCDLFIVRSTYREFLMFDSFMNHSCDPNTAMVYSDKENYKMIALREININDELTCDYEKLDNNLDHMVITCIFKCNCGSKNCRKIINS